MYLGYGTDGERYGEEPPDQQGERAEECYALARLMAEYERGDSKIPQRYGHIESGVVRRVKGSGQSRLP